MKEHTIERWVGTNAARPPPGSGRQASARGNSREGKTDPVPQSRTAIVIAHVRSGQAGLVAGPDL